MAEYNIVNIKYVSPSISFDNNVIKMDGFMGIKFVKIENDFLYFKQEGHLSHIDYITELSEIMLSCYRNKKAFCIENVNVYVMLDILKLLSESLLEKYIIHVIHDVNDIEHALVVFDVRENIEILDLIYSKFYQYIIVQHINNKVYKTKFLCTKIVWPLMTDVDIYHDYIRSINLEGAFINDSSKVKIDRLFCFQRDISSDSFKKFSDNYYKQNANQDDLEYILFFPELCYLINIHPTDLIVSSHVLCLNYLSNLERCLVFYDGESFYFAKSKNSFSTEMFFNDLIASEKYVFVIQYIKQNNISSARIYLKSSGKNFVIFISPFFIDCVNLDNLISGNVDFYDVKKSEAESNVVDTITNSKQIYNVEIIDY